LLVGDPAALARFRQGDPALLTEVFERTAPLLRRVLRACGLRSDADVDDALQSVFVKAFAPDARAAYSGLSPYEAYLKSIARNVVRDLHRSGRARFEVLDPERAEQTEVDQSWADPQAQLEEAEARLLRQRFVDGLERDVRTVYDVCLVEGLPEREAADKLGCTRHRLRKGLAGIERALRRFVRENRLDD
jgi:RNA polymerase sigma factor (sigma-70 family)